MASRKEQKEKLRQERLEREQAAAAAAARRKRLGYTVAGVLVAAVVVAIVVVVASGGGGGGGSSASASSWPSGSVPARKTNDMDVAVGQAGCKLLNPKSEGRGHTEKAQNYKSQPPSSGAHNPTPASDKAYLKSPGNEHLMHAREHARLIFWSKAVSPAKVKGNLYALYKEAKDLVILTPTEDPMPYQVAATAWTQLLGCPAYNDKVPDA